jgi:sugar O-acyltransferase (sialic acid O-acetyltransferase NeuD family)
LGHTPVDVVIVGAGGQGLIVADTLLAAAAAGDAVRAIGFVDDEPATHGREVLGLPVLGPIAALSTIAHDGILIAIGDNRQRRLLTDRLTSLGEALLVARHPSSTIARGVELKPGTMVSAGVVLTPMVCLGMSVLLNTRSSIDHQSTIGDFVHAGPGVTIGANVIVGDEVLLGLGCSIISGCRIGARTVVGAGAVVVRDLPTDVLALGVPGRVMPRT